jgi:hypothetical protein
VGLLLLHCSKG